MSACSFLSRIAVNFDGAYAACTASERTSGMSQVTFEGQSLVIYDQSEGGAKPREKQARMV